MPTEVKKEQVKKLQESAFQRNEAIRNARILSLKAEIAENELLALRDKVLLENDSFGLGFTPDHKHILSQKEIEQARQISAVLNQSAVRRSSQR